MKAVLLLVLLFCTLILPSCASKSEDAVIGKWNEVGGAGMLEFFRDGTVTRSTRGNRVNIWGSYRFLDANRMRVELTETEAPARHVTYMVTVSGDVLCVEDELADRWGEVKYQKEGTAGTNDIAPCKGPKSR